MNILNNLIVKIKVVVLLKNFIKNEQINKLLEKKKNILLVDDLIFFI